MEQAVEGDFMRVRSLVKATAAGVVAAILAVSGVVPSAYSFASGEGSVVEAKAETTILTGFDYNNTGGDVSITMEVTHGSHLLHNGTYKIYIPEGYEVVYIGDGAQCEHYYVVSNGYVDTYKYYDGI